MIDYLGDKTLLRSTDYPHHDSPFPNGIKTFLELPGLRSQSKRKILRDDGATLFGVKAGTHDATLVALRNLDRLAGCAADDAAAKKEG